MEEFKSVPMPSNCVPSEICEICASKALFHYRTETLAAYCTHSMTGAILPLKGTWGILRGVEANYFNEVLAIALTKAELTVDVAKEINKIVEKQAENATKH